MIRYLKHTEIDKTKWDQAVQSSAAELIYGMSWYLDIVSSDWEALIEDDYSSVFPLTHRKKFTIQYLYQPHFTQQLGLFGNKFSSGEKLRQFLLNIPDKFKLIEIQINSENNFLPANDFTSNAKRTFHLSLENEYSILEKQYSENLKRNLKKASKAGISLSRNVEPAAIINLFRNNKGKEVDTLKEADYSVLQELYKVASGKDVLECVGVMNNNKQLIAGAAFLKSKHSYIFHFSGNSDVGKECGAMAFLIDTFIREHCNQKMVLDFEGSMDENLARFYKSFGSKEIVYLQIHKNNLPPVIRWLK